MSLVERLVSSPFLKAMQRDFVNDDSSRASYARLLCGSILHLAALEMATLLREGVSDIPHRFMWSNLEYDSFRLCTVLLENWNECGDNSINVFFSILKGANFDQREFVLPALQYFDASKIDRVSLLTI